MARGLSPFILESEGLVSALRELAASTQSVFNVNCKFEGETALAVPDLKAATHLYRIAQEAVANAVKHAKAKNIDISLTRAADKIVLAISDDGVGIRSSGQGGNGMGLRTMQYRAGTIGAALLVQAPSKGGTKIVCFLQSRA